MMISVNTNLPFKKTNPQKQATIGFGNSSLNIERNSRGAQLSGANLANAELNLYDFDYSNLERANFAGATIYGASFQKANLAGANFENANLDRAYMSKAKLSGANLSRAQLTNTHLSYADLTGAKLPNSNLSEIDLLRGNLSGTNLSQANLSQGDLSHANLVGANLSGANLSEADFSKANLSGANLLGANFKDADLYGADLSGAILSREDLSKAKLEETNTEKAIFIEDIEIEPQLSNEDISMILPKRPLLQKIGSAFTSPIPREKPAFTPKDLRTPEGMAAVAEVAELARTTQNIVYGEIQAQNITGKPLTGINTSADFTLNVYELDQQNKRIQKAEELRQQFLKGLPSN